VIQESVSTACYWLFKCCAVQNRFESARCFVALLSLPRRIYCFLFNDAFQSRCLGSVAWGSSRDLCLVTDPAFVWRDL